MRPISRTAARAEGLTRFFIDSPCCRGHVSPRYVSNGGCIACAREQGAFDHEAFDISPSAVRRAKSRQRIDYNRLTQAQIDAWYTKVANVRENALQYKHEPLEELGIVWRPPLRERVYS